MQSRSRSPSSHLAAVNLDLDALSRPSHDVGDDVPAGMLAGSLGADDAAVDQHLNQSMVRCDPLQAAGAEQVGS